MIEYENTYVKFYYYDFEWKNNETKNLSLTVVDLDITHCLAWYQFNEIEKERRKINWFWVSSKCNQIKME